jgi:two-component system, OmpR family, alkaline phosphatase synthesis response regulator PhoP
MQSILLIEDDVETLENLEEILKLQNFHTIVTTDGVSGLQLAKKQRPDLVICDVMLPKLDGYQVLMELHRDEDSANIPLIFITAKTERSDFRQGMELGADDYLTKPFTTTELLSTITTCLEKRRRLTQQYLTEIEGSKFTQHELKEFQNQCKISVLLQGLAQNIRSPLSNINLVTYLLKNAATETEHQGYVTILEEEYMRAVAILNEVANIQELLSFSKVNLAYQLKLLSNDY